MGIHEDHILPAIMDIALAGLKEEREEMVRRAREGIRGRDWQRK